MQRGFFRSSFTAVLMLAVALGLTGGDVRARTVLDFDARVQPISLGDWGDYVIDAASAMTAAQVASDPSLKWAPTLSNGIYPLDAGQILWIRFTVPPAPDADHWLLEIPYPAIDRASLYTATRAGQWEEQRTGDLTAVSRWPTPHRHPLLAVDFNAETPTRYLLRLENGRGFSAPIQFVSSPYLLRSEQQVSLFLGVYFGLALLGFAVGLAGVVLMRDRAYLYFGLCSALIGLTQAAASGAAGLHLWPDSPNWNDRSLVVLATGLMMSFLLLNATMVSLAQRSRARSQSCFVDGRVGRRCRRGRAGADRQQAALGADHSLPPGSGFAGTGDQPVGVATRRPLGRLAAAERDADGALLSAGDFALP